MNRRVIGVAAILGLVGLSVATPAIGTQAQPTATTPSAQTSTTTSNATTTNAGTTTTSPAGIAPPTTGVVTTLPASPLKGLKFTPIATNLTMPVEVLAPLNDGVLYVVERIGTVKVVISGKARKEPFANLRSVLKSGSIEQGLLGMAFHPNYPTDTRVFFYHSIKNNDNVLVSYTTDPTARRIDPNSRKLLLTIDKEPDAVRHNAGALRFSPDGLLYIAVGDAARASKNGQNPKTLPGSILRIDVNSGNPYAIPADNPFVDGKAGAPEVFWYGLRNPWRFSIDAVSGLAYIGDVGQEKYEEVNAVDHRKPGINFGWPIMEGNRRYSKGEAKTALTPPIIDILHGGETGSCSITGGEVYRGTAIPELFGHYFYADWCLGWIRSLLFNGSAVSQTKDWSSQLEASMVSAFGHTFSGELLVVDYEEGTISQVVPAR